VLRGNSWSGISGMLLRSSFRLSHAPTHRYPDHGFRCVVVADVEKEAKSVEPATPKPIAGANTARGIASATKDKPFENSLGMRFVPVPITGGPSDGKTVLFSIWETRVKDYETFIKDNEGHEWPKAEFPQKDDHPAVMVSWEDAQAFCAWLTELDRKIGKLGKDEHYRLPTDHEWSCAVGIGTEEDADVIPSAKRRRVFDIFPWGEKFPPPKGAGNYYGEECKRNPVSDASRKPIEGYDDGFDRTAPVGSFEVNEYGLYDIGGNVWEWCEDWLNPENKEKRVQRGGSWLNFTHGYLLSSGRGSRTPTSRGDDYGFRCVVVGGGR
jgi:formylglycine-generating enzyme required for sulfatase activity